MVEEKIIMFQNRLGKVARHLGKQAKRQNLACYRVYDHDLSEFPFCIEYYGDKLYVAEYKRRHGMTEEEHDEWMQRSLTAIEQTLNISSNNIFLKLRQRKPGRLGQYQRIHDEQHEFIMEENGLKFIVNLSDYLDTGLFLDHRITRQMVREQSKDKKVLNLFAYTGSFSVYAAAGGASEVITVDLSKTYLSWAERNLKENGYSDDEKYKFVHADVKQYLKDLPANYFDTVVMDPPTFSNSKRMDDFLEIQRDHVELINDCLAAMKTGGGLYFSTNFTKFVLEADKLKASAVKDITKVTTAFDFEGKLSRFCYYLMK
ncbi:MAG: class I SAM-dependent methyltransferase [Chitinophagaceae bacterium]